MDFLLSLSAKAKEKLSTTKTQNKSVMYSDQLLSEEDTKWAYGMKKSIADYLRQGAEGPYFYRMVETVLSRDKNWVRWKVENCPSIEMSPVSPDEFNKAKDVAGKMTTNKRLRPTPMGYLSLNFLSTEDEDSAMDRFQSQERYELPELMSFKRKIADDDFEIEMPTNNQTKAAAVESKASNSWRALRIASKYKLASFDRIENPDKIDLVFEDDLPQETEDAVNGEEESADLPEQRQAIVIIDPTGTAKSTIIKMLLEKKPGAFTNVPPHTTRQAKEGETEGQDYYFVDAQAFNMMRDGDQFLEFTDAGDVNFGTSRKVVDSISNSGKVPVMELDHDVSLFPPIYQLVHS
jgi:THO complex subunit 1